MMMSMPFNLTGYESPSMMPSTPTSMSPFRNGGLLALNGTANGNTNPAGLKPENGLKAEPNSSPVPMGPTGGKGRNSDYYRGLKVRSIRKRSTLALKDKVDIIRTLEASTFADSCSRGLKSELAQLYGLAPSTISGILKEKDKILDAFDRAGKAVSMGNGDVMPKKLKKPKYEDVEAALLDWVGSFQGKDDAVFTWQFRAKANDIARSLGYTDFNASCGFIERFKQRHGIDWSGKVMGMQSVDLRVCASPGRDKEAEENKHHNINGRGIAHGGASKRKASAPTSMSAALMAAQQHMDASDANGEPMMKHERLSDDVHSSDEPSGSVSPASTTMNGGGFTGGLAPNNQIAAAAALFNLSQQSGQNPAALMAFAQHLSSKVAAGHNGQPSEGGALDNGGRGDNGKAHSGAQNGQYAKRESGRADGQMNGGLNGNHNGHNGQHYNGSNVGRNEGNGNNAPCDMSAGHGRGLAERNGQRATTRRSDNDDEAVSYDESGEAVYLVKVRGQELYRHVRQQMQLFQMAQYGIQMAQNLMTSGLSTNHGRIASDTSYHDSAGAQDNVDDEVFRQRTPSSTVAAYTPTLPATSTAVSRLPVVEPTSINNNGFTNGLLGPPTSTPSRNEAATAALLFGLDRPPSATPAAATAQPAEAATETATKEADSSATDMSAVVSAAAAAYFAATSGQYQQASAGNQQQGATGLGQAQESLFRSLSASLLAAAAATPPSGSEPHTAVVNGLEDGEDDHSATEVHANGHNDDNDNNDDCNGEQNGASQGNGTTGEEDAAGTQQCNQTIESERLAHQQ